MIISSEQRRFYVMFLFQAIGSMNFFKPGRMTKYCAVHFLHKRYLPFLERQQESLPSKDIHFNSLICLWIASKIHEATPITITMLQVIARRVLENHPYSREDIVDAELKMLKAIGFDLRSGPLVSTWIEGLLAEFREEAKPEEIFVSFRLCLSILDHLYLTADEAVRDLPTELTGASILAAVYLLGVPADSTCISPIFTWLQQRTNKSIAELKECTREIIRRIPVAIEIKDKAITHLENMS